MMDDALMLAVYKKYTEYLEELIAISIQSHSTPDAFTRWKKSKWLDAVEETLNALQFEKATRENEVNGNDG